MIMHPGTQQVTAVEMERIPGLGSETPAGCKASVPCRRGVLRHSAVAVPTAAGQMTPVHH